MRITDALNGEHGALYLLMTAIEGAATDSDLISLQSSARLFESVILAHAHLEDESLFAALEEKMPGGGPVTAMRAEHQEIEGELARVASTRQAPEARAHLEAAIAAARSHFRKEEVILFPMAEQLLTADELDRMGAAWAKSRGVALPAPRRAATAQPATR